MQFLLIKCDNCYKVIDSGNSINILGAPSSFYNTISRVYFPFLDRDCSFCSERCFISFCRRQYREAVKGVVDAV